MVTARRVTAVILVLLAMPSLIWIVLGMFLPIPNFPEWHSADWWLDWTKEAFFVLCFLGTSILVWKAQRMWPIVLVVVVGFFTYTLAGSFIQEFLLVPSRLLSYVPMVLKEAASRGRLGGTMLIWSLIVFPLALPMLLVASLSLGLASRTARQTAEIT